MNGIAKNTLKGACIIFTCSMALWTLFGLAFAGPEYGLVVTITLLAACLLLAALQTLWFSDAVLKAMAYPGRVLGFGLSAFVVLAACAFLGDWLPADNLGAWGMFALIYLVILAVLTIAYWVYYRRTAVDMDAALARYRRSRE